MAYCDLMNLTEAQAAQNAGAFGGGMGRMGEVCGTLTGAYMVIGAVFPMTDPSNISVRQANYAAVKSLSSDFRSVFGDIICRNLLAEKKRRHQPEADDPNAELYRTRPCAFYVATVAVLLGNLINSQN